MIYGNSCVTVHLKQKTKMEKNFFSQTLHGLNSKLAAIQTAVICIIAALVVYVVHAVSVHSFRALGETTLFMGLNVAIIFFIGYSVVLLLKYLPYMRRGYDKRQTWIAVVLGVIISLILNLDNIVFIEEIRNSGFIALAMAIPTIFVLTIMHVRAAIIFALFPPTVTACFYCDFEVYMRISGIMLLLIVASLIIKWLASKAFIIDELEG